MDEQVLKDSLIRSLSREAAEKYDSDDPHLVRTLSSRVAQARKERDRYQRDYWEVRRKVEEKYGTRWDKD